MSLLITTSLLDSVAWAKKAPDTQCRYQPELTWKQRAYEDLKRTLAREWSEMTPEIKMGIEMENRVYSILNSGIPISSVKCSPLFMQVLKTCEGSRNSVKTKSFIGVDGKEYCLYGKIDIKFPDKIIDLKTTREYKGPDKYLGTNQHKIYCYNDRVNDFDYLIMEYAVQKNIETQQDSVVIKNVHTVSYHTDDFSVVLESIEEAIRETMSFLESFEEPGDLKDLYYHKYNMFN